MLKRHLYKICFDEKFGRQMRFIAGPRQVGKTTLAKSFLEETKCINLYYNWDQRKIRARFKDEPYFYHSDALTEGGSNKKWVCFDEIHKYPKWKDILKDAFDSFEKKYRFIVTGSARLDLFRKAGDSLSGRYFLFRLLPVSLFEITGSKLVTPPDNPITYVENCIGSKASQKEMDDLIRFGGFPEPLTKGDEVFSSNWHDEYIDTLLREDLRDLTKIHELENVITLMHLLPERIGSPLSLNSIREDIEISYTAVKNYVRALILTYVIFSVPPYHKNLKRTLKKEKKIYFFDWTQVRDEPKRFENYVACELKQRCELWTMSTKYKFELFYIRMRDGKETDFLITRDEEPFIAFEVKLSSKTIENHNIDHARKLGIPLVQIVKTPGMVNAHHKDLFVISASNFLA